MSTLAFEWRDFSEGFSERKRVFADDDTTYGPRSSRSGKTRAESTVKGKMNDCRTRQPTYAIYKVYALPGVLSAAYQRRHLNGRLARQITRILRREMCVTGRSAFIYSSLGRPLHGAKCFYYDFASP